MIRKIKSGTLNLCVVRVMILMLCINLLLIFTACGNQASSDTEKNGSDYSDISYNDAISIAKDSDYLARQIAREVGLVLYSPPVYTTYSCDTDGDYWVVTLKGTISGYTDEYMQNVSFSNPFKAVVYISMTTGKLCNCMVYKV